MRIIAGKHRGRNIMSVESKNVRPTTGKAREALFSILTSGRFLNDGVSILEDATIVDICCGTGAVGLEALSRGAAKVIFIDKDPIPIQLVKDNLRHFGEEEQAKVLRIDALTLPLAQQRCHVAFIDPPYESGLSSAILKGLATRDWLIDGAVIICEVAKKESITPPEGYEVLSERNYGKTKVVILEYHQPA